MDKFACWDCGSTEIEESAWVNINTGRHSPDTDSPESSRCTVCCEHGITVADVIASVVNRDGAAEARLLRLGDSFAIAAAINTGTGRAASRERVTRHQARDWMLADYGPGVAVLYSHGSIVEALLGLGAS